MKTAVTIEQLTLGDLATEKPWVEFDDPQRIAPMSEHKRDLFLRNPVTNDPATVVQLLAMADGCVAGRVDLLPGMLLVRGEPVMCSWGSGMFVPESQRGRGIGKALAAHRAIVHDTCCSCGVSQMLQPIYTRLGWTDFPMRRFILLRTARPIAERIFGNNPLGRAAGHAGSLGTLLHGGALAALRNLSGRHVRVEHRDAMPESMDELLTEPAVIVASARSARWINWVLSGCFNQHERNRQGLLLMTDGHGQPLGYALYKSRYHETASHRGFRDVLLGSLQDWMIFQPDRLSFRGLVLLTVRELANQGADAIEVCVPPGHSAGLRALGFLAVGAQHALFTASTASSLADPALADPAAWFIRPGDGDNFFT